MIRRIFTGILVAILTLSIAGCRHNNTQNPIAHIDSKQPDKVLFDRAMDALQHGKYETSRLTLQTLINTYPDSEYIARAKLAIGDSWYQEGSSASLQQAEAEYKDFITFFPQSPEAAEAQMKVAQIHYNQMEKADRDFTNAKRAEDEYRQMIEQFPDSKLVPQAKQRLREVQEVLADREFRIGRFYYMRESWAAAIARLKSVTDTYPLYSQADEALMMLGESYQRIAQMTKASRISEGAKATLIKEYEDGAAAAYDRIITRYPVSDRAKSATAHLKEMERPVPTPTPEAIAQNKAEQQGREELGRFSRMTQNLHKHPDMTAAAKIGEPTMVDPAQTGAPALVKNVINVTTNPNGSADQGKVSIEKVGAGAPGANQPAPRSDTVPPSSTAAPPSTTAEPASKATDNSGSSGNATGIDELKVNTAPASTEPAASQPAATQPPAGQPAPGASSPAISPAPENATPAAQPAPASDTPPPANTAQPAQSNGDAATSSAASSANTSADSSKDSSSKKKKKKKLGIF